tara:strand:+ start:52 stop:168 length:117 start_codon:yes stop_codon:yes gene_type:complete
MFVRGGQGIDGVGVGGDGVDVVMVGGIDIGDGITIEDI